MRSTDEHLIWPRALLLSVTVLAATQVQAWAQSPEYQVKAEFMERFTRFIDWPAGAFRDDKSPFVLCVAGKSPFGKYLEELVGGRQVKKRRIVLRAVGELSGIDGCHLLFVPAGERARLQAIVAHTSRQPILTIGDSDGFARSGLLVNFYLDDATRVRFEVNAEAIKLSGLKFSSKLLKLARITTSDKP